MTPFHPQPRAPVSPKKRAGEGCDGFDIYRLDCAVDALRDARLSQSDRAELARISLNLTDLMEAPNGHAH